MNEISMINVDNPKQTISSCFKSMHYVVPAFQREYVWESDEIELLISDIEEAFKKNPNKEYFLGTTVVYEKDGRKQLIDGQQRMTTFFLILCAIAKHYTQNNANASGFEQLIYTSIVGADGSNSNMYTLELQYEASSQCLSNVWEEKIPDEDKRDGISKSSMRIYNAYEIIDKRLNEDFSDFQEYMKFAGFFSQRVVFIQIGANDLSDALKIFETINQRGKGLNSLDLLKNMLFMQVDASVFDSLNNKWKSIMDGLEKMDEKPLRFLRYFLTSKYDITDAKPEGGILNDDEIYKWLYANNDKCHYKESPTGFTDGMKLALDKYKELLYPDDQIPGRDYLLNIKRLMGNSYRLHLVPLMAFNCTDPALRTQMYKWFEVLTYYFVVNRIKSNTTEKLFSKWCPAIRKIDSQSSFDDFVDTKIVPTLADWNSMYHQNFLNLSLATLQQYKIKAILARIAKYIDVYRASGDDYGAIGDYIKSKNEIEHIMPKTCDDISKYGISSQDEYELYKNKLGNLSLLEKTINGSIQNDDYSEKSKAYVNSAFYMTKSLPGLVDVGDNTAINRMNQKLKSWNDWNKTTIDQRHEVLYELSKLVWPMTRAE